MHIATERGDKGFGSDIINNFVNLQYTIFNTILD